MRLRQLVLIAALLALAGRAPARQQPVLPEFPVDTLTIEQAVRFALDHQPSINTSHSSVRAASASVTQSVAGYLPTISGVATATRTDGAFVSPGFPVRNQSYNLYSAGIQASETIFDFGRTTSRVSASNSFLDASQSDYEGTRGNVIMNAEIAYFGLMQAAQVSDANQAAVDQAQKHLTQAKAFYTVGTRAQLDVMKAEVDLANANVAAIRARNQVQIARLQLENAMGVHPKKAYAVRVAFAVPEFTLSPDSAEATAFDRRPEMVSARARLEANKSLVTAAWTQHLPVLSASGAWTWSNFDFPLVNRWNAGLTFSLPIFQGFAVSAGVEAAQAGVEAAQAKLDSLSQFVSLDVEQNYLSLREAADRIGATSKLVDQAQEALNLAERQYAAGVGTPLEVTDAEVTLTNARITRIQALFDYNSSLVRLQRSMGTLERRG